MKPLQQKNRFRPRLEQLEDRALPSATIFSFSTGEPDGRIATASRQPTADKIEIETADDFILPSATILQHATFTGLIPAGASLSNITDVTVAIYHVFPKDSDTTRTIQVPTRTNSPADSEFTSRDSAEHTLVFTATILDPNFTAANSVVNGSNPKPNQTPGGEGPVSGQEVLFDVRFTSPFKLAADHYFFVPQVELTDGNFLWLSAPKPTNPPFQGDLQSWTRNAALDPDWLRIGTDVVGGSPAPTFNASFSLDGVAPDSHANIIHDDDTASAAASVPAASGGTASNAVTLNSVIDTSPGIGCKPGKDPTVCPPHHAKHHRHCHHAGESDDGGDTVENSGS